VSDLYLALLKGFILGVSVAAPVGPISVLIFTRTLKFGFLGGIFSASGAAMADAFYAAVAAFGLTLVSTFLLEMQTPIRAIGAAILLILGVLALRKKHFETTGGESKRGLLQGFGVTFLLTLSNPMTILLFATLFAGLSLAEIQAAHTTAGFLVAGTFLGTFTWMVGICTGAFYLRAKVTEKMLKNLNKVSGILFFGFAGYLIFKLF